PRSPKSQNPNPLANPWRSKHHAYNWLVLTCPPLAGFNLPGDSGSGLVGYATPYPIALDGRRYVVGFMGKEAFIAEADTGRQVWNLPWQTDWDVNAATPIFHDGHLLLSSGYKHGSALLKLRREGDRLATTPVWENKSIRAKFQTPVLYQGHLYVSDEVGLKCVEWATGAEKWSRRGTQNGTVLIADGQLLVFTEDGTLLIAPATPTEFKPTAEVQLLDGRCWTVPVLHRGHLYVRNLKRAACFRLTA
ncbi:MAG: PQQ-binding-like beta-propeller repeat protein, partial [Planctomycetota bacterium]